MKEARTDYRSTVTESDPDAPFCHRIWSNSTLFDLRWSPDGRLLAAGFWDGPVRIITPSLLEDAILNDGDKESVLALAWSPNSQLLAVATAEGTTRIWDVRKRQSFYWLKSGDGDIATSLAWAPDGKTIATGHIDGTLRFWNVQTKSFIDSARLGASRLVDIAWSIDGRHIAVVSFENNVFIHAFDEGPVKFFSSRSEVRPMSVAWESDNDGIAVGTAEGDILILDRSRKLVTTILEGHTEPVTRLEFFAKNRLLASHGGGSSIIWNCDTWSPVWQRKGANRASPYQRGLAVNSVKSLLIAMHNTEHGFSGWHFDQAALLKEARQDSIKHVSAKIVLVGESNAGKSCLAMRIAESRYPNDSEQGTTHGMRFWPLEAVNIGVSVPKGQRRDVVLWDMGGQDEYRLVHQLFLHDTTVALFLFDPTRGRTAFEEIETWNKSLERQLQGKEAVKLLVGSKMEKQSRTVDQAQIKLLIQKCGFKAYIETSALSGRGIDQLKKAIADSVDWDSLALTTRPELFQRIHDEIEQCRAAGEVVLPLADLEKTIYNQGIPAFDSRAVQKVTEQLAKHGTIANILLGPRERMIVLQIGQLERYAGSLILTARNNPRQVPALDQASLSDPDISLPGIEASDRLPRLQERIILECVSQLMVEHGICFQHEKLLVFPTLFLEGSGMANESKHSISLFYDFGGAVDNIYASLVASLDLGEKFGAVRLGKSQAEFERAGHGLCGIRKVNRGGGLAHLDVYFGDETPRAIRDLFISFVEDHISHFGVAIVEHLRITCICGFAFSEETVLKRIENGSTDIVCPECELRTEIELGANGAREKETKLIDKTWALKTEIEKRRESVVRDVKRSFITVNSPGDTDVIKILHLSDLHFKKGMKPREYSQPLIADIKDPDDGLGLKTIDYLVISGDLSHTASPQEFETARTFVSHLIDQLGLTAERCVFVPGNHDVSWENEVYEWRAGRKVDLRNVPAGAHVKQGDGYLVRIDDEYPKRFANFSSYFYHPILQKAYPMSADEQGVSFLFEKTGIQFIALNSCSEVDEYFRERSTINASALSSCLTEAEEDVKSAVANGLLKGEAKLLKIGVWHHPVTGSERIDKDAFLSQLRKAGVRLCLHGHVHEERAELIGYLHPRKMHVIGGGTLSGDAQSRPESTPRLYNVLAISKDFTNLQVHTRCQRKAGGAWEPWAMWPSEKRNEKRAYYMIDLD